MNMREQAVKELEIPLPIEDHQRDLMSMLGRSDAARQILRDYVTKQGGLARPGLPEDNPLHDPHLIRPQPRLAGGIVPEYDGLPAPGDVEILPITCRSDRYRRPLLLLAFRLCEEVPYADVEEPYG